jgi:hypothetical protein
MLAHRSNRNISRRSQVPSGGNQSGKGATNMTRTKKGRPPPRPTGSEASTARFPSLLISRHNLTFQDAARPIGACPGIQINR